MKHYILVLILICCRILSNENIKLSHLVLSHEDDKINRQQNTKTLNRHQRFDFGVIWCFGVLVAFFYFGRFRNQSVMEIRHYIRLIT